MSKIKMLNKDTIQKIAAGEVIERPKSVVKELVENSIDANSSNITIRINNGGIDSISVSDDGTGIERDDCELCLAKHATSKIENDKDLYNINTLGFRGEALSSINSISKMSIVTKTKNDKLGLKFYESDSTILKEDIVAKNGTSIEVRDIFYNIPARKKFLKDGNYESSLITDLVYRLSVANNKIGFRYFKDDKIVLDLRQDVSLIERIHELYGKDISSNLLYFSHKDNLFDIKGYFSNNIIYRANRKHQYIYINGRNVSNQNIVKAVEDSYRSLIPLNKKPMFFIFITVDPSTIDVNIHPNKQEVKIEKEDLLLDILRIKIKDLIQTKIYMKSFDLKYKKEEADEVVDIIVDKNKENSDIPVSSQELNYIDKSYNRYVTENNIIKAEENQSKYKINTDNTKETLLYNEENKIRINNPTQMKLDCIHDGKIEFYGNYVLASYKIVGIVFNTYVILEDLENKVVVLMDQHAAHERVLYEKFLSEFKNDNIFTQELIQPKILNLSQKEKEEVISNIDILKKLGFGIEILNDNIILRYVPILFNSPNTLDLVSDVLGSLSNLDSLYELKIQKIMKTACKAAIKGGDRLYNCEIDKLIKDLKKCNQPLTCPHGRPTLTILSKKDLEKLFLRIMK